MAEGLIGDIPVNIPNNEETSAEVQPEPEVQPEEVSSEEPIKGLPSDDNFEMPEKFEGKSAEEIARAYVELEKFKQTKQEEQQVQDTTDTEQVGEEQSNKYLEEFQATGDLSEETRQELYEKGYTKEQLDEIIEYERFKVHKQINEVVGVIGGMEEYVAMEDWAIETLPQDVIEEFKVEFANAGKLARQAMLKDLYASYKQDNGVESILHTNQKQLATHKGYTSQHELQKDMADPRYGTDRSYTQAVERKLAASKVDF